MSPGAGLLKAGEAGKGLESRWYPEPLIRRIDALRSVRDAVTFEKTDAFEIIERFASDENAVSFIDPPYTVGGKSAGRRLYNHCDVDRERLFRAVTFVAGAAMLTVRRRSGSQGDGSETRSPRRGDTKKNAHRAVIQELRILKP